MGGKERIERIVEHDNKGMFVCVWRKVTGDVVEAAGESIKGRPDEARHEIISRTRVILRWIVANDALYALYACVYVYSCEWSRSVYHRSPSPT